MESVTIHIFSFVNSVFSLHQKKIFHFLDPFLNVPEKVEQLSVSLYIKQKIFFLL